MGILTPPRCILLDLDGTLVDSVADISASANFVRESLGLEALSRAELSRYVGDGAVMLIRRALAGRRDAPEDFESLDFRAELRKFRSHYHDHCLETTKPFDGVVETLAALAPLPMAIVSNKPEPMCRTIADGLGLAPYLGAVIGARPGVGVKPDPALLIAALEELGVDGEGDGGVWMVGDSGNDVLAGRALGATTIGVRWGLVEPEKLETFEPDLMLSSFRELSALAKGWAPVGKGEFRRRN